MNKNEKKSKERYEKFDLLRFCWRSCSWYLIKWSLCRCFWLTRSVETNIERMYRLFSIFTTNAMKFNHHYSRKKKSLFYLPFTQTGTRYSRLKLKILNRRISKRNSSFYFVTFAISFVTT
jgi:hypothetical protein